MGNHKLTPYRRKYMVLAVTETRRRLKEQAVAYKGGRCQICGYNRNPAVFEFHHPDPKKKDFSISGQCLSFEKLKSELDKTDMLCANCHREVHDAWNVESLLARRRELDAMPKPPTGKPKHVQVA